MEDKVYFIHESGIDIMHNGSMVKVLGADFFIRSEVVKQYDGYSPDYLVEDCPYVKAFLKNHSDYSYVGSTDNIHKDGWGMSFDGFTEVDCPEVEDEVFE